MVSPKLLSRKLAGAVLVFGMLASGCRASLSQALPPTTEKPQTTQFVTFVQPDTTPTVPAGRPATVQLHFRVVPGMHINSHSPADENLIPTRLAVTEVNGLRVTGVDFPAGESYSFSFDPATKLSVYTGEFLLTAHVSATVGPHLLEGVLRYQACDNASCFPPKTLPIALSITAK